MRKSWLPLLMTLTALAGISDGACQQGYDSVHGKCYGLVQNGLSRAQAKEECASRTTKNLKHQLWTFESPSEYHSVMKHFWGEPGRSGAAPNFWINAIWIDGQFVWDNGVRSLVTVEPEQGTYHVCCSGQGCFGNAFVDGDCGAIGRVSFGAADSGFGMLSCQCDGDEATILPFICEAIDPDFDCTDPVNGESLAYPSTNCDTAFFVCVGNDAIAMTCPSGLVYDPDNSRCEYPELVEGCLV